MRVARSTAALVTLAALLAGCSTRGSASGDAAVAADTSVFDTSFDSNRPPRMPIPDGCTPQPERCDGVDDDCDGYLDEGMGSAVGCGVGEVCDGDGCVCPPPNMCDGRCVDYNNDPMHCGGCGEACADGQSCSVVGCCDRRVDKVDLLFLVDNSNSMQEEQVSLAAAFPRLITALTSGDADENGRPEFPAVRDLHVGVITADMGTGGHTVPTCRNAALGDDAALQTAGAPGCEASYPSFLRFMAGGDRTAFAEDFGCVATVGTGGCAFEQQLEAVLKAVTPSSSPLRFQQDSAGQGDGANEGFLREDSVLAIVVVTDEEDCSASDGDLYDPVGRRYPGLLTLRCFEHPSALHPVQRYVDGLVAARGGAGEVIFSAIAGIPQELAGEDYAAMLSDERMQERIDPDDDNRLTPSCDVPGRGLAFPPRRIVEVASALEERGAGTTVQSICQSDFVPAIRAIAQRVGTVVGLSCAPD